MLVVLVLLAIQSFIEPLPWWVFLLPLVLWLIITAIGSGLVQSGYHIKTLNKNSKPSGKQIALTFDDGPTPYTEKVLDVLARYHIKVTFFCIGSQIEIYPHIFKRILNEGHTVGNHTYSHSHKMGFFSKQKITAEVVSTDALIEKYTFKKPLLFRPPFGVTTPNLASVVKQTRHYVIGWNIRSLDAVIEDEAKIYNRITSRLSPGSIILLHDTSQKTVNVLEQLLVLLQQQNYEAVTVNELLNIPAYEE